MNLNEDETFETRAQVDEPILEMYAYGSRVYGCVTEKSDHDYIIVVESEDENLNYSVTFTNFNATVYSEKNFIKRIQNHEVNALECIFQEENDKYLKYFKLDTEKLRRKFSAVASNSYVKCKKKLKEGEVYIAKKSMFHSVRILNFGIQIAKYGKIVNYSCANVHHDFIFYIGNDWNDIDARFKPIYNAQKTLFKKLSPLDKEREIKNGNQ